MTERTERCETCKWWNRLLRYTPAWEQDGVLMDHWGECRRYPGIGEPMMFPLASTSDWCGEWTLAPGLGIGGVPLDDDLE